MMSCMVEMGNGSLSPLLGAWSKSTTAQLGLGRLRLNARFSARVLGGGSPSQIRLQAVVMPQKEGSSECEDPSELPSDGESLNIGWSNLCARGVGFVVTGMPLHTTAPLHSSGAAWKEGFRVSTFSMGFILRRLFCVGKKLGGDRATVNQLHQYFKRILNTNILHCKNLVFTHLSVSWTQCLLWVQHFWACEPKNEFNFYQDKEWFKSGLISYYSRNMRKTLKQISVITLMALM